MPGGDRGNRDKLGVVDRDWGELGRQNRAGGSGDRDEGERLGWNLKNNQSCIKIQKLKAVFVSNTLLGD